jgi:hypothetical protein
MSQDQAVLPAATGHELLKFVVRIVKLLLEYTLPPLIEYSVRTVLVGGKSGFGIVALGQARSKIFSSGIMVAPRLSSGREIFDGNEQSFQIFIERRGH